MIPHHPSRRAVMPTTTAARRVQWPPQPKPAIVAGAEPRGTHPRVRPGQRRRWRIDRRRRAPVRSGCVRRPTGAGGFRGAAAAQRGDGGGGAGRDDAGGDAVRLRGLHCRRRARRKCQQVA